MFKQLPLKPVPGGQLYWVPMTNNTVVPIGAVVGGFEKGEVLYVARAVHNRSLCPGKYIPSSKHAYVAWGHRAHKKDRFEVRREFFTFFLDCVRKKVMFFRCL